MAAVVDMRGIVKRFGPVVANGGVDFQVEPGEIHALLGENGAGKTTLMNVLYGLYPADGGSILFKGKLAHIASPRDAIAQGIGMVHQHFMLVKPFTVAENVALGVRGSRLKLDLDAIADRIRKLSKEYGLAVDPHARIYQLSVGMQQRVEIIKALYHGADTLILDEPTAVLTPQEANELFEVLRGMAGRGGSVVFISHKLHEVLAIADRVTVLRNGRKVDTTSAAGLTKRQLASMMVGREVILKYEKPGCDPSGEVLALRGLKASTDKSTPALRGVDLRVRCGEIVGVAGVDGNGQRELAEVVAGLRKADGGEVVINGRNATGDAPLERIRAGLGYVPEDRRGTGLVLSFSVCDNLVLKSYAESPFTRKGQLQQSQIEGYAEDLIKHYQIKTPSATAKAANLSGGNQQKVVLAREIARRPKVLVVSQPTRGLDVGAMEFIHKTLIKERSRGMGILLISSDLDEILEICDRVVVFYEGHISGEFVPGEVSLEEIGLMMAGARHEATA